MRFEPEIRQNICRFLTETGEWPRDKRERELLERHLQIFVMGRKKIGLVTLRDM